MKASHKFAEDRYELLREQARTAALKALPVVLRNSRGQPINSRESINLSGVDFKAKVAVKAWMNSIARKVDWNWRDGINDYAWRNPKRFELSVWHRETKLCGLALGRPTWSGNRLRLDFIEANPDFTPLSGLVSNITVVAAITYAKAIGAGEIRLMHPVNTAVREYYLKALPGFAYDPKGDFCHRSLV